MYCFDQETTDYARPIVFVVQVGLQDSDHGPVLDDGWPTVMRTEVREMREHENHIKGWIFSFSFLKMRWSLASCLSGMAVTRTSAACPTWRCRARPTWWLGSRFTPFSTSTHVITSLRTAIVSNPQSLSPPPRQFCAQPVHSHGVFCRHQSEGRSEGLWRIIEGNRRRMVVDVRLENKGENAYSARLNITYTPNLRFSSLIVKVSCSPSFWISKRGPIGTKIQNIILIQDTSDIKIDCYVEVRPRNEKICNVSAPFMRAKSQVRQF